MDDISGLAAYAMIKHMSRMIRANCTLYYPAFPQRYADRALYPRQLILMRPDIID